MPNRVIPGKIKSFKLSNGLCEFVTKVAQRQEIYEAEVLRNALALYEKYMDVKESGGVMYYQINGKSREVEILVK